MTEEKKDLATTSLGLPQDLENVLCYALQWLTGFFFLLAERKDPLVRFHATLSVLIFVPVQMVLIVWIMFWTAAVPARAIWLNYLVWASYAVLALGILAVWAWLMRAAYRCSKPAIPGLSRLAERVVELTTPPEP